MQRMYTLVPCESSQNCYIVATHPNRLVSLPWLPPLAATARNKGESLCNWPFVWISKISSLFRSVVRSLAWHVPVRRLWRVWTTWMVQYVTRLVRTWILAHMSPLAPAVSSLSPRMSALQDNVYFISVATLPYHMLVWGLKRNGAARWTLRECLRASYSGSITTLRWTCMSPLGVYLWILGLLLRREQAVPRARALKRFLSLDRCLAFKSSEGAPSVSSTAAE